MAEPPAKKQKTEGDSEEKKELEQDAKVDSRPKLRDPVVFPVEATTMNVLPSATGGMLIPLSDGGFQYLLAGARANVGVNAGRYSFEVKIVEFVNPFEESAARGRQPAPRNYLRVGLATSGSSLFLGETQDSVCFDTEGMYITCEDGKPKKMSALGGQKLGRDEVITIVLNLAAGSPNTNTVSLFRDGVRLSEPQALPEGLKGKELFPAITWRNMTVAHNFGPAALAPLPFKCRMWQDAAQKDVQVAQAAPPPRDGKYEVVFPVCLPDEGTFDWLDLFLEKNPHYVELSDRVLLDWMEKSGVWRQRGYGPGCKTSNDKPEMAFGVPSLDDGSIKKILQMVVPLQNRNYIVMEVKGNLLRDDRMENVTKWCPASFKRIAVVLLGEPSVAFKKRSHELILKQKQEAADGAHKVKLEELRRKRLLEKRQRDLEKAKKKQEREKKKKDDEIRRKLEFERKKKEAADKGETFDEVENENKDDELEDDDDKDEPMEDAPDDPPPKVELSAEDQKQWFRKNTVPDLSPVMMSASFTKFSAPDKDEGFDEIRYDWQNAEKCKEYIKQWVQERKLTTRVEDITPSDWFAAKWKDWQKCLQSWHAKQTAYKAEMQKKADDLAAKEAARKQKRMLREERERAAAEAKVAATDEPEKLEEEKPEEKEEEEEEDDIEEKEEGPMSLLDFERLDVFGIEDFMDVGHKQPLFSQFGFEDWTMMSLRFEMHLLVHAFRKDVNDPDRLGIHIDHLSFYYSKYYKKQLNPKFFGVDTVRQLLDLIRDCVICSSRGNCVEAQLPDDLESLGIFVMLTEEARRDRVRRIDLGDESARLNIMQPSLSSTSGIGAGMGTTGGAAGAAGARPMIQVAGVRGSLATSLSAMSTGLGGTRPTVTISSVASGATGAAGMAWRPGGAPWMQYGGPGRGFGGPSAFGRPAFQKGGWGSAWGGAK